jgi:predicted ATPase
MRQLEKLSITNYKSIHDQTLALGRLNVFIGGNGVGKSNLISVFRFLREVVTQNLAGYTAIKGGAEALLHFGRKVSRSMSFSLEFAEGDSANGYHLVLLPTDDDSFLIQLEQATYQDRKAYPPPHKHYDLPIAVNVRESGLRDNSHQCAKQAMSALESYRVYHFHDTSDSAPMKATGPIDDNRFLQPQAENLAAFLYWLQEKNQDHYRTIVDTVRQIAPFFDDFKLAPSRLNESRIRLEWREKGSDAYFNAHALSDGTLRFICLATLLLQPEPPAVLLLDEPELGLHPAAVSLLADLLSSASTRSQVLVATQSVTLVNQFGPEDVWAVDREDHATVFKHLSEDDMGQWLDHYSLGELWEKNLLGARP